MVVVKLEPEPLADDFRVPFALAYIVYDRIKLIILPIFSYLLANTSFPSYI
jgi:hypothetical protein